MLTSGRMRASSQASKELSTASLTAISKAFRGLSKPNRWRFFSKNSAMLISRCFLANSSAVRSAMDYRKKEVVYKDCGGLLFGGQFPQQLKMLAVALGNIRRFYDNR